jgi:TonB-dependent starch-binding outer membrane protein SusC
MRVRFTRSLLTMLLLVVPAGLHGQESGRITGTVASEVGRPLNGVQIFIPGTGIGTLTNAQGTFALLNVAPGTHTVRAQLIGWGSTDTTVTVGAGASAVANFQLRESAIALDEVVVTGAGQAVEKKRLGNTVATINAEQIQNAPVANLAEVLQGREPGVVVQQTGGMAGEGANILIRGGASLSQKNQPIIYVDGVRVNSEGGQGGAGAASRLNDINPDAIARIEVLKGAAAATLYGTEASNGVIQIFTKNGAAGAPQWQISTEWGFSKQIDDRYLPLAGFARSDTAAARLTQFYGRTIQPFQAFETPLTPFIFETGSFQAHSLSVSGGSDVVSYFVSGRLSNEDGSYGGEQYGPAQDIDAQKQANANLSIYPWENLRLRLSSNFTDAYHEIPSNGNNTNGAFSLAIMSKPELARGPAEGFIGGNPTGAFAFSTIPETMNILTEERVRRFGGALTTTYTPMQDLSLETTFGLDVTNTLYEAFRPFGWNVSGVSSTNPQGQRLVRDIQKRDLTFDGRAGWNTQLADDWSSSLTLGAQLLISDRHRSDNNGNTFPAPGLEVTGAGLNQSVEEAILKTVNAGVFAQEQIGFRDWLFTTVGGRFDRHSAFGESAGSAFYPKASVSFVASDMPGYALPFSTLRLRGAIGTSGLQPGAFDKFTTFDPLPSELGPGVSPGNLGNEDLKPEVSTEWEVGSEVGFFDNRIALNATYWNRTTKDVLVNRQFAPSGGFVNTQLDNIGEMKAWGLEVGANGSVWSSPKVSVNLFASASFLDRVVSSMGGAPDLKVGYFRYLTWVKEGFAPGAFFGAKLASDAYPIDTNRDNVADSREEQLAYFASPRAADAFLPLVVDEDGDGDLIDHYLGKPIPDWQGSVGAEITLLRNLQLVSMFEFKAGNFVVHNLSHEFRQNHAQLGRNTMPVAELEAVLLNPASTAEERLDAARDYVTQYGGGLAPYAGMNAVEKGDYMRWRELSLAYTLPAALVARTGASSIVVSASARNLALWTGYSGIDPENNVVSADQDGVDQYIYGTDGWRPGTPRRFTLSARVGF